MNILYLCDEYPPCQHGGIGSVTQNLARELAKKGHNVSVYGFYPYYRLSLIHEVDQGVKIYRYFYGNKILLKLSRNKYLGRIVNVKEVFNLYTQAIKEFIEKNKIDIIEIPDFNEAFRYTGPRFISFPDFGIPSIIKLHGSFSFFDHLKKEDYLNESTYRKEDFLIQHADKILAVSEFSKKVFKEIFNYSKDIEIIHNGIPINSKYNYRDSSNNISVVFAGTLVEKKGILSLIKAWESVVKEIPTARLFLYGKGDKGTLQKIKNLISDKTRRSIELKGYVSRDMLYEIYSSASCAIFPSYAETFGMAPLESMLAGCPTIFTKRASGDELITHGANGLLVDPDNPLEIADAIKHLLLNRPEAIRMGEFAAKTIIEKFNISRIADEHIREYSTLLRVKQIE